MLRHTIKLSYHFPKCAGRTNSDTFDPDYSLVARWSRTHTTQIANSQAHTVPRMQHFWSCIPAIIGPLTHTTKFKSGINLFFIMEKGVVWFLKFTDSP